MATNYDIDYNDKRFTEVEADKKAALNEVDVTYGNMVSQSDKFYQNQIDAAKDYAETQKKNQQAQTDFAIDKIEQQKEQAKKDYTKEQSGAYVDWQKQSNQYGANAEQMAASGLAGSGYSESSQVSMYNTYQNRVTAARESFTRAVLEYDNAIKDARLQNNAMLAEIAYNSLREQLELSLEGFQYKNQLILDKANKKLELDKYYHTKYQDVLAQINQENALAEEVRQADMANARQQEQIKLAQAELQLQKDKFAYQKQQDAAATAKITKSTSGSGKKNSSKGSSASYVKKQTNDEKKLHGNDGKKQNTASAKEYLNALIKSGASKDKVSNEIAIALREGAITKKEAQELRSIFTPRGLAY